MLLNLQLVEGPVVGGTCKLGEELFIVRLKEAVVDSCRSSPFLTLFDVNLYHADRRMIAV
jgi:hypothetical protein